MEQTTAGNSKSSPPLCVLGGAALRCLRHGARIGRDGLGRHDRNRAGGVAAVTMPLTYSIATGIGLGFITYALIKLIAGRFADAKPAVLVLALIFAVKFALG